jgi:hypothetical protein
VPWHRPSPHCTWTAATQPHERPRDPSQHWFGRQKLGRQNEVVPVALNFSKPSTKVLDVALHKLSCRIRLRASTSWCAGHSKARLEIERRQTDSIQTLTIVDFTKGLDKQLYTFERERDTKCARSSQERQIMHDLRTKILDVLDEKPRTPPNYGVVVPEEVVISPPETDTE